MTWQASLKYFVFSCLIFFAAQTLFNTPLELVWIYTGQLNPNWSRLAFITTVLGIRALVSLGVLQQKSWAWLVYSLDKTVFLGIYGWQFIVSGSAPHPEAARAALYLPTLITTCKLFVALASYQYFALSKKEVLRELRKPFSWPLSQVIIPSGAALALFLYFLFFLTSQISEQVIGSLLVWANSLQKTLSWLPLSVIIRNDNTAPILGLSAVLFGVGALTSLRKKRLGLQVLFVLFFFAFALAIPRQLQLLDTQTPLYFFALRRTEVFLSAAWLTIVCLWLIKFLPVRQL